MPIVIQGASNSNVISYEFELRYDPLIIQPLENPVELVGSVSRGLFVVSNIETEGLLKIAAYGPMPLTTDGVLLNLRFRAIGSSGSASSLIWERFMLNEGDPAVNSIDGRVEISAGASNQANTKQGISKTANRNRMVRKN